MVIHKEILYNDAHQPVKVQISYLDWLKIQSALGGPDLKPNGERLLALAGTVRFEGDPLEIQKQMRAECPD